jgi:hypothetical protein
VDPQDRTWIGTGDGHVLVLDKSGRELQRIPLAIPGPRKAVNASPAISQGGIVIGDSEGALHLVPWSRAEGGMPERRPARLPADAEPAGFLRRTDVWGIVHEALPPLPASTSFSLRPGEPLCLTLQVLRGTPQGDEPVAGQLQALHATPEALWDVGLSGDGRYAIVSPKAGVPVGVAHPLSVRAEWTHAPQRLGLRMRGGQRGSDIELHAHVTFVARRPATQEPPAMLWYQRIAMSLPTLMPSYNQIGFETLLYGITRICRLRDGTWLHLVTGWQSDGTPDPATRVRFPLRGRWDASQGHLQLQEDGVYSELNGFDTRMERFAITAWLDEMHRPAAEPVLRIRYLPSAIGFYGGMLEALGMGDARHPIEVLGSGELAVAAAPQPAGVDPWWWVAPAGELRVHCGRFQNADQLLLALAVVTPEGEPLVIDYAKLTSRTTHPDGTVELWLPPPATGPWTSQFQVWLVANGVSLAVPFR